MKPAKQPTPAIWERAKALHTKDDPPMPGKFRTSDIAAALGVNDGLVSTYLAHSASKPCQANIPKLELLLSNWFDALDGAITPSVTVSVEGLFPTALSASIASFFSRCHRSGQNGLVWAEAGAGKGCAVKLYHAANPKALVFYCTAYRKTQRDIMSHLRALTGVRTHAKGDARTCAQRTVSSLVGFSRLLIFDNAQRLSLRAIRMLMDIWDEAQEAGKKFSIVFVGNEDMLAQMEQCPQVSSRLHHTLCADKAWTLRSRGNTREVCAAENNLAPVVDSILSAATIPVLPVAPWPDAERRECASFLTRIAAHKNGGRLRTVTTVVQNAARLQTAETFAGKPLQSLRAAYAQLHVTSRAA